MSSVLETDSLLQQEATESGTDRIAQQSTFCGERSEVSRHPNFDNADEWFEESESEESYVDELDCLFNGMKIGIDHHLSHRSTEVEETGLIENTDTENEIELSETINQSFCKISQCEKTLLQNITMDWEETDEQSIILGQEKRNRVVLPANYFDEFIQSREIDEEMSYVTDKKFICSVSQLHNLVNNCHCKRCLKAGRIVKQSFIGSVVDITLSCENQHEWKWSSSAMLNKVYAINIQLLAAVILSGNLFVKFSLLARFLNLAIPSEATLYRVAKLYVYPQVYSWWDEMQKLLFELFANREVNIAADGRNDSPGYSATYCNYTLMDTESNLILHQEIIDVRNANYKSPNMEKLGCKQGLAKLRRHIDVKGFVTDDHNQISAMMSMCQQTATLKMAARIFLPRCITF